RAANILVRSYFDDETLTRMLLNLRSRVVEGGLLVVCRTEKGGINRGTLFRLADSGDLAPVARLGGGSDTEDLVTSLPVESRGQQLSRPIAVGGDGWLLGKPRRHSRR